MRNHRLSFKVELPAHLFQLLFARAPADSRALDRLTAARLVDRRTDHFTDRRYYVVSGSYEEGAELRILALRYAPGATPAIERALAQV